MTRYLAFFQTHRGLLLRIVLAAGFVIVPNPSWAMLFYLAILPGAVLRLARGADWNFYGYLILKRITPSRVIWRTAVFKLLHPFKQPSLRTIWQDIKTLQEWAKKMTKWM